MIEHSYVECSSATIQGLTKFKKEYPDYRKEEIEKAVARGVEFIKSIQREDGSWYGSWAVCFTYGTWFGIEGLLAAGENSYREKQVSENIRKACEFLLGIQRKDGSWGESYRSCVDKKYVPHEKGQVINTAWAVLALLAAGYPDQAPVRKGIEFILRNQEQNGDWPQQGISGVFNHNCMITYTAYRNVFPLWALGRFTKMSNNKSQFPGANL
jgi:squalene/oxidosqualene cyclase-like protein